MVQRYLGFSSRVTTGGLIMLSDSQTARPCATPSAYVFRGYPYIYTSLNTIYSSNSDDIYFPTWYHEFFLLLLLSRAHYCPTSHQVHRSLSPLLSLWPATMLLGLWLPRPLPLYRSASPTRWPPFRPPRRRPLRLVPTCMPSPSSSKKNRLPSPPYRLRPRRLPCSWH
jgi:hypothetical protein